MLLAFSRDDVEHSEEAEIEERAKADEPADDASDSDPSKLNH